jgi:hypothetical protein
MNVIEIWCWLDITAEDRVQCGAFLNMVMSSQVA